MQRIISCDDHKDISTLPPDLWTARLPARLLDVGPRVRETPNGRFWTIGDTPVWRSGGVDPRLPNAWLNRGALRMGKGQNADAVTDLERYLELEPNGEQSAKVRIALEQLRRAR